MNFALFMFIALLVTGAVWLLDHYVTGKGRAASAKEPWWVEYSKSFFPVILIVFLLRSFLMEPFKIPSGSMIPTLLVGDFILVNKFTYGIRLPIINTKIIEINQPQHGDVMVFRYPKDPSVDYIKRVIGMPGDKITYRDKRLIINGKPIKSVANGEYSYIESGLNYATTERYDETLGSHTHAIIVQPEQATYYPSQVEDFPGRENCVYEETEFTCTVPKGFYFMMGDNRDRSNDSRYWGFVPDKNIVGKAFMIWWNFDRFKRIGQTIN